MRSTVSTEVYSPAEIAQAAGVPIERVVAALGRSRALVAHDDAVRLGRALSGLPVASGFSRTSGAVTVASGFSRTSDRQIFSVVDRHAGVARSRSVSLALSSAVHTGLVATAVLLTSFSLAPTAAPLRIEEPPRETLRLVFLAAPGPGGGGGGGGLLQPAPAPKALRQGRARISSPVPVRRPPRPIVPVAKPPEPEPQPLRSEPLPVLVAPIVSAPADSRDRIGVLETARTEVESHGRGEGGGAGTGAGTGLGAGDGSGVGPGSDGGTGGGPFRPGSGIEAPRLLREVKADYTEDARRRGIEGEVVMEIVVMRTGAVGDVRFLRRLGDGLDERAAQAVRQWRFTPATRKGLPVDVIVEVGVEFRLR